MAHMTAAIIVLVGALAAPAHAFGPIFGWQRPLNTDARTDDSPSAWRDDWAPRIVTDKHGVWLAIWQASYGVSPFTGDDPHIESDIMVARSTDGGQSWAPPVLVNTDAAVETRFDIFPTLATDGAGTWVATWQSRAHLMFEPGEDLGDVWAARSTDDGATWSAPVPISTRPTQHDWFPVVAAASPGTFVIVWSAYETGPQADYDLYVSRSTDGGLTWSPQTVLNRDAAIDEGNDTYPSLASDGAGTIVVAWNRDGSRPWWILVARSTDAGATWSDPLPIQAPDPRGNDLAEISYDGAGTWMIAWSSFTGEYQERRLRLARSTDAGVTWTAIPGTDLDGTLGGTYVFRTRIAGEPAGNWVVTWESHSIYGSDTDIFMIQSVDGGLSWKAPRFLNSLAALEGGDGNDYAASIATDGNGGWLTVWMAAQPGYYQTGSAHPAFIDTGSDGDVYVARGRFMSCSAVPRADCQAPTAGAKLLIKRDEVSATGKLGWTWTGTTSPEAFGNPLLQQIDLVLCTYDGDTLVSEAPIPAIGACGPVPCWKDRGSQLTYRDRDRIPAGVEQIGVRKGKLKLKASGRSLPLPPMPAALPLTVQLQASTGVCLGADYGPVDMRANDARTLRGKGR